MLWSLCLQIYNFQSSISTTTAWTVATLVPILVLTIKPFLSCWYSPSLRKDPHLSQVHSTTSYSRCLGWWACPVESELRRGGLMGQAPCTIPTPVSRLLSPLPGDEAVVSHTAALSSLVISRFSQILASWPPRQKARERDQVLKIMWPERNTRVTRTSPLIDLVLKSISIQYTTIDAYGYRKSEVECCCCCDGGSCSLLWSPFLMVSCLCMLMPFL